MLNNGINYHKKYSLKKEYNTQAYNNGKIIYANEYSNVNHNLKELELNIINSSIVLKYLKIGVNLNKNKIMDKQDFLKNIK